MAAKTIDELRTAYNEAAERVQEALRQIDDAPEDADAGYF